MNIFIYYLCIGFLIAFINNYLFEQLQTDKERNSDNTGMIIALVCWILFWPIGLVGTVSMIYELIRIKNKHYE